MERHVRSFLYLALVLAATLPLQAENVTTLDGKTYTNLKVTGETPDTVKIIHDGGISVVKKINLPESFLELHEMAAAPKSTKDTSEAENKKLIADFVAANPTFTSKDGRLFKSSEITAIEPSGLKLTTDTGLVRVKFIDLPEKVRTFFKYDPLASAEYERVKEENRASGAERELKLANAASFVDSYCAKVVMYLKRNVGRGWLCDMVVLEERDEVVVTSRPGSPLSGPKVLYESQKVRREVATDAYTEVMVFGLPDYNSLKADHDGRRIWSGKVYSIGSCEFQDLGGNKATTMATHVERDKAIDMVVKYGTHRLYTPMGEPEPDATGSLVATSTGTGFAITHDGYLATSAHVVDGATAVEVYVDGKPVPAKVIALDTKNDLAVIHAPGLKTRALALADANELPLGSPLFVVGYPWTELLGTNVKLTRGDMNSLAKDSDDKSAFQMSVPIQGGNSGGPVCTRDGRVAGVVKATLSTLGATVNISRGALPQNINYAVRAVLIKELARSIPSIVMPSGTFPDPGESIEDMVVKSTYLIVATTKQ